jgi:hypothetical protein
MMTRRGPEQKRRLREERSRRAVDAAVSLTREHGLRVEEPVVLNDLFSLMVHLRAAPVVTPSRELPPGPHERNGSPISFRIEVADAFPDNVPPQAAEAAQDTLGGAVSAADRLPDRSLPGCSTCPVMLLPRSCN